MPANRRLPRHQLKYHFSFSLTVSLVFSVSQVSHFFSFSLVLFLSPKSSPLTHTFLLHQKSNPIKSFKAISPFPSPSQQSQRSHYLNPNSDLLNPYSVFTTSQPPNTTDPPQSPDHGHRSTATPLIRISSSQA